MRVAFVTQPWDEVLPHAANFSSIAMVSYQLAKRLRQRGHEVILYGKLGYSQSPDETDDIGIRYRRFSVDAETKIARVVRGVERVLGYPSMLYPYFASNRYFPHYAEQIARDIRTNACDIIHVHNFSQFVPVLRKHNPAGKIVLHMHCEWLSQLSRNAVAARLQHADLVIGCSEYVTQKVRDRFPEYADRCKTLTNGVDTEVFAGSKPDEDRSPRAAPRLLFVGRVSPEKGLHVLLDAFQKVLERSPDTQLHIVGPNGQAPYEFLVLIADSLAVKSLARFYTSGLKVGRYPEFLASRIARFKPGQVVMAGEISQVELPDHYHAADMLINPSLSEAFGMSLVEAGACGLPVIGTRVGGMTEIIEDGVTGIVVEPDSPETLANAIASLLADKEKRNRMGNAGRTRAAELFTWKQKSDSLLAHYEQLLHSG